MKSYCCKIILFHIFQNRIHCYIQHAQCELFLMLGARRDSVLMFNTNKNYKRIVS